MKYLRSFFLSLLFLLSVTMLASVSASAAGSGTPVMTVTVKSSLQTATSKVYAEMDPYWGFDFQYTPVEIAVKSASEKVQVTLQVTGDVIDTQKLAFVKKTGTWKTFGTNFQLPYSYESNGTVYSGSRSLGTLFTIHHAKLSVSSLQVKTSGKGFHPSKGNSLPVYAAVKVSSESGNQQYRCRLRILNSKGKYVFQKTFAVSYTDQQLLLDYKWSGKASKNNAAGRTAGAYVPDGKYKAQVYLYAAGSTAGEKAAAKKIPTAVKTVSFKVSKSAPSGSKALNAVLTKITYSGNATLDYIAEQMIKSAGVTSSMGEDEKVRRIYHYMTMNFKHIKSWQYQEKFTVYYNTSSLASKIKSFQTSSDKKWLKGDILYDSSLAGWNLEWNMVRRVGVCTDNAMIFKLLLAHVGVKSGLCNGYYLNRDGSKPGHTWNWVIVNGTKYYYDVDVEIINYRKGQGDYYWYKKSYAESQKTHQYVSQE